MTTLSVLATVILLAIPVLLAGVALRRLANRKELDAFEKSMRDVEATPNRWPPRF